MDGDRWDRGQFTAITPRSFRVNQNRRTHAEIRELLGTMSRIVSGRRPVPTAIDKAEDRLKKALDRTVTLPAGEPSLDEVLKQLLAENRIPYLIDTMTLADEKKDLSVPVMREQARGRGHELLDQILEPHDLFWFVEDEVVKVTTTTGHDGLLVTRVYDVRKFLGPTVTTGTVLDRVVSLEGAGPWGSIDGIGGEIDFVGFVLAIRNHRKAHRKIESLLGPPK